MTYATLEKKLSRIPSAYVDDVSAYLDFILFRASEDKPTNNSSDQLRTLGGLEHGFWMAEDFDAPLEDFKEYM